MGFIYMLTSPNGKAYIGQTTEKILEDRLKKHRLLVSNCRALINAIKKYSWEKFQIDSYECPDDELNKHEEMLIETLGTLSPGGYNLKKGGDNNSPSDETRAKISTKLKGQIIPPETREKMRLGQLKREKRPKEVGLKISESKKKISDEQILAALEMGKNCPQIAREYSLTPAAIYYRVKRMTC
ncbi:GIY-YIG catalytic domain-containing endonuclease [Acanthocystis turfacea Chlorella virus Br0604L]|nr:GIY-YIG catalytic domain-containing endonuclease [Acanthocystis turfacea Chlorella virus Br0604L]